MAQSFFWFLMRAMIALPCSWPPGALISVMFCSWYLLLTKMLQPQLFVTIGLLVQPADISE